MSNAMKDTDTTRAIEYHVTETGNLVWVAQKDDQSLVFKPTLEQAKQARDELNRIIAELADQGDSNE